MRWLVVLLLVAVLMPSVLAAAPDSPRFYGPSEVITISSPSPTSCGAQFDCNDNAYGTTVDEYSVIADGSTLTDVTLKALTDPDATGMKVTFDVDGMHDGEYALRMFVSADTDLTTFTASTVNIFTGENIAGSYTNTFSQDASYHVVAEDAMQNTTVFWFVNITSTEDVDSFTLFSGNVTSGSFSDLTTDNEVYHTIDEVNTSSINEQTILVNQPTNISWFAWRFEEEESPAFDDVHNLNGSTFNDADLNVTGFIGSGIYFDGTDDYFLALDDANDSMDIASTYDLAICISFQTMVNRQHLFELTDVGNNELITGEILNSGKLKVTNRRGSTTAQLTSTSVVTNGVWHHACIMNDVLSSNTTAQNWLYVDGVIEDSAGVNDYAAEDIIDIHLGAADDQTDEFEGTLDEFCGWQAPNGYFTRQDVNNSYLGDGYCGTLFENVTIGTITPTNYTMDFEYVFEDAGLATNVVNATVRWKGSFLNESDEEAQFWVKKDDGSYINFVNVSEPFTATAPQNYSLSGTLSDYNFSDDFVIRINDSLLDGNLSTFSTDLLELEIVTETQFPNITGTNYTIDLEYVFSSLGISNDTTQIEVEWYGDYNSSSADETIQFYLERDDGTFFNLFNLAEPVVGQSATATLTVNLTSFDVGGDVIVRINDTGKDSNRSYLRTDMLKVRVTGTVSGIGSVNWCARGYDDVGGTVNTSDQQCTTTSTVNNWIEVPVTNMTNRMFDDYGRLIYRIWADSSTANVAEIYLKRPVWIGDFQIIPQGVAHSGLNQYVENEWLVISEIDADITNPSCEIEDLLGNELNSTVINLSVTFEDDNKKLVVGWFSNDAEVSTGQSYEVECDFYAGGAEIAGLEQYIYITAEEDILDFLTTILDNILQLVGLIGEPVEVRQMTSQVPTDGNINLLTQVTMGGDLVTDATCNATVIAANGTNIYTEAAMGNGGNGLYNLPFTGVFDAAPYTTQIACLVNDTTGQDEVYRTAGSIQAGPSQIYEGIPELTVLETQYLSFESANVLAQLRRGSNEVDDATCGLTVYYPNGTKALDNVGMTYFGENGLYNYSWQPEFDQGGYPANVECTGGKLGGLGIEAISVLTVREGVHMEMIS